MGRNRRIGWVVIFGEKEGDLQKKDGPSANRNTLEHREIAHVPCRPRHVCALRPRRPRHLWTSRFRTTLKLARHALPLHDLASSRPISAGRSPSREFDLLAVGGAPLQTQ